MQIPNMIKAVQLKGQGGPFELRTVAMPQPGEGEVLIKIAAAPVNPSDLQRIKTVEEEDLQSFIPGIEGSGTVVAAGKGLLPHLWLGKRVACSSSRKDSGTWAEYLVTSASHCFPIPKSISDEQGSMLLVNPMTAVAFFDIIRHDGHKGIINSAAASALGGMIRFLAHKNKIEVINVVRDERQKKKLMDEGATHVLISSNSDFAESLHKISHELNATLGLDPIAGSYTQLLLDALPYGSTILLYGNLSGGEEGTTLRPLLLENKKLHGFYLVNWMKETSLLKTIRNINNVKQLLKNDIKISIQNRFPLSQTQSAINTYLDNMTAGKVLLIP
jgi:NADPH:quinone reductase